MKSARFSSGQGRWEYPVKMRNRLSSTDLVACPEMRQKKSRVVLGFLDDVHSGYVEGSTII